MPVLGLVHLNYFFNILDAQAPAIQLLHTAAILKVIAKLFVGRRINKFSNDNPCDEWFSIHQKISLTYRF